MKQGYTLTELAAELERRAAAKKDFIAPAEKVRAVVESDGGAPVVNLALEGQGSFPIASTADGQIAEFTGVPKRYLDRCKTEAPELYAANVNHWLQTLAGKRRMIRTLDGRVRAVLSDAYRPLENEDLAEAVIPVLLNLDVVVMSAAITETRFYIKAVDRAIERDIPTGKRLGDGTHTIFDTVNPAITVSNSEIGFGALSIETSIFTRACTNLATFGTALRRLHVGGRADLSDEIYALLTDETRRKTDAALWAQVRDLTKAAFDEARFEATVKKLRGAAEDVVEASPVVVIERAAKKFSWTDAERDTVLTHFVREGDLTRYGLHGAITRAAEDLESYDRATEFERLGGAIIDLSRNDWKELAEAA